jgi:hypothetical protein
MRYDRVGCQLYPGSSGVHATVDPCSVAASEAVKVVETRAG